MWMEKWRWKNANTANRRTFWGGKHSAKGTPFANLCPYKCGTWMCSLCALHIFNYISLLTIASAYWLLGSPFLCPHISSYSYAVFLCAIRCLAYRKKPLQTSHIYYTWAFNKWMWRVVVVFICKVWRARNVSLPPNKVAKQLNFSYSTGSWNQFI